MKKIDYPYIDVPASMKPHFKTIFEGEYDISGLTFTSTEVLALDIGANMGAYTHWVQARYNARVIAFEPDPSNFKLYKSNTLNLTNIEVHNFAVSTEPATVLYHSQSNPGAHSIHRSMMSSTLNKTVQINSAHPDVLPEADILKADTEGCEVDIIGSYLNKHSPSVVSYEYHNSKDERTLFDMLTNRGYILANQSIADKTRGTCNWYKESDKIKFERGN
jgi:FkbM family methyltransferase